MLELFTANRLTRAIADRSLVAYARFHTKALDRLDVARVQEKTLLQLVQKASGTRFGIDHRFQEIRSIRDYQQRVPVQEYEYFWQNYWKDAYPNLANITWPGAIPYFALSSGTTSGATKYIPISHEMLASNRQAAKTTISLFRNYYPQANVLGGKFFFLSGNTNLRVEKNQSRAGDLSAIAAIEVNNLIRPYTFPPLELSGIADWTVKMEKLAQAAARENISAISGVPSWILVLFDRIKAITGKSRVCEVWPNLRLVIHGGTKFEPYRKAFENEIGDQCHFCEVYPASEGFIATEDPRYKLLRVVPNHNLFFEFVPVSELENGKIPQKPIVRHTLAEVVVGVQYAVVVTSCAGVWSYLLGDTICFESTSPPLLRFTGRTKYFLSAFGEHLISEELEKAVACACNETGAEVHDFHVGPVFPVTPNQPGYHLYLIEFRKPPKELDRFSMIVDRTLCELNEDYDAHRKGDLTMLKPQIQRVKEGGFEKWMMHRKGGELSVQHKVPRMDNSGELTSQIRNWLIENNLIENTGNQSQ